jgi:hypothetical protein
LSAVTWLEEVPLLLATKILEKTGSEEAQPTTKTIQVPPLMA